MISQVGLLGRVRRRRVVTLSLKPEEVLVVFCYGEPLGLGEVLEARGVELAAQIQTVCRRMLGILAELVERFHCPR